MQKLIRCGIPLVLLVGLAASAYAQLTADGVLSFRVCFGLNDISETKWDGSVTVSNGELIQLRDWHPRPENSIEAPNQWTLSTHKGVNYRYPPYFDIPDTGVVEYYWTPGVILDVKAEAGARVNVRTEQGRFAFNVRDVPLAQPKAYLNGSAVVERVTPSKKLTGDDYDNDFAAILGSDNGEVWVAWLAYKSGANHVMARRFDGTAWGEAQEITEGDSDAYLVKMGREGRRPMVRLVEPGCR